MQIPSQPPRPHRGLLPPGQLFARTRSALPTTAASLPTASTSARPVQGPGPQLTNLGQAASSLGFVNASATSAPSLQLPPRPTNAPTGSQFIADIAGLSPAQREQAIQQQILQGNIPDHLRQLTPLTLTAQGSNGETLQAVAYVTPEYLAVGSNADYVLVPMSPITAQAIADATGTTLPTRKLVDTVYAQAQVKLRPSPQTPGPQMTSVAYFERHHRTVAQQQAQAGAHPGDLIAGHKKDVVITPRLDQKPQSVAIYGWHQPNGKAIQPLSTIHENTYADYSHGVRLVGPTVQINGATYTTTEALRHPQWSRLLSDEGIIQNPRAVRP